MASIIRRCERRNKVIVRFSSFLSPFLFRKKTSVSKILASVSKIFIANSLSLYLTVRREKNKEGLRDCSGNPYSLLVKEIEGRCSSPDPSGNLVGR